MRSFCILLVTAALLSACTGQPEKPDQSKFSGYLAQKYYEKLTKANTPSGEVAYRYIAPEFKASNYHSVIIDPVITFPKPKPTSQISENTIAILETRMTSLFSSSFSKFLPLAKSSGKGVIRMKSAITGVNVSSKSLEAYEYIPIALIVSGVSYATGTRDQEVNIYLESIFVDSVSNEVLAVSVRQISGEDLEDAKTRLEAKHLNKGLEKAGQDFVEALKGVFSK